MKYSFQFGSYSQKPEDSKSYEYEFPDDILFFTGGLNDIGHCKYENAYHIVGITKASDADLEVFNKDMHIWAGGVFTVNNGQFKYANFRVNGYAFIELRNCIPCKELEFTDIAEINKLLDLKNHPAYVVERTDQDAIANIIRIDYIESAYRVKTQIIQLNAELTSYYAPIIYIDKYLELENILHPFYKFAAYELGEEYGKELFDEILYANMAKIYPEFKERLKGYDLQYLQTTSKKICDKWNKSLNAGEIVNIIKNQIDNINEFEKMREFQTKIPLKNETK